MQTQFQYIIDLAKQYNGYSEKPNTLFEAINNLSKNAAEDIFVPRAVGFPLLSGVGFGLLNLFSALMNNKLWMIE